MRLFLATILILGLVARPAAKDVYVDVELMLAVDVSRSMSAPELEIQRRGYAEALAHTAVYGAIRSGFYRKIALTYVEWSGTRRQRVIVPWRLIETRADLKTFAARLTAHFDPAMRRTS